MSQSLDSLHCISSGAMLPCQFNLLALRQTVKEPQCVCGTDRLRELGLLSLVLAGLEDLFS